MFKNILVALDSLKFNSSSSGHDYPSRAELDRSAISRHLFDEALTIAKANQARLVLLHILSPGEEQHLSHSDIQTPEFERLCLEPLRDLEAEAIKTGVDAEFHYDAGDPGLTICKWADIWEADLIIVGRRNQTNLQEALLGSVSSYVVQNTPCSVFVTHLQVSVSPEAQAVLETRSSR